MVNGGVQCWGENAEGELGDSSKTRSSVPVQVQGLTEGVTAIEVMTSASCAVVPTGVRCWGHNASGELGDGTMTGSTVPTWVLFQ